MNNIEVITTPISLDRLKAIAQEQFGNMVKAVVDIERQIMGVGGELHADEEALLLDQGSAQKDLWGVNIYLDQPRDSWLEFDSMINLRPSQGNRSRFVEDESVRQKITKIVNSLIS